MAGEGGEGTRDAAEQILENTFLDGTAGDDFIGVQCYERTVLGPTGPIEPPPGTRLTQMGYEYWPQVVEYTVRRAAAYTGLPVVVTENGLATEDDPERIEFISTALEGLHRCIADGIDVRGLLRLEPARQLRVAPRVRPQARPVRRGPRDLRPSPQAQRPLVRQRGQVQRPDSRVGLTDLPCDRRRIATVKGDRVEVVVDVGEGVQRFDILATRAGRRVEISNSRGSVEVTEVTRSGRAVRTARFMAARVVAVVEHPAEELRALSGTAPTRYGRCCSTSMTPSSRRRLTLGPSSVRRRTRRGIDPDTGTTW